MERYEIYTAGAMEAYDGTGKANEWREKVKDYFENSFRNVFIINPVDFYSYGSNLHKTESEIFRYDLFRLKKAHVVLVNLDCIRKSIGTCIELYEAFKSGIPVIGFIDKELNREGLIKEIHPWIYECITRIETGKYAREKAIAHIENYYLTGGEKE